MKRRILMLLTVVALMVVMLAMSVAPAIAQGQGVPPGGPCGVFQGFDVGEARPVVLGPAENPPGIVFDCVPTGRPS
jgi:hypothetical protein